MDTRRYSFEFANRTFLSTLCDIFDDKVPKSYLPPGVEAETNINFMPFHLPPSTIYLYDHQTNRHVTCGLFYQILKETAIKMKAK